MFSLLPNPIILYNFAYNIKKRPHVYRNICHPNQCQLTFSPPPRHITTKVNVKQINTGISYITRGLRKWTIGDPRLENVRTNFRRKMSREFIIEKAKSWNDETIANVAITLVHQCDKMLAGLLEYQKQQFLKNGGIKEQMTKARLEARSNQSTQSTLKTLNSQSTTMAPACPKCGKPMLRRMQKKGEGQGREFWGCSDYPNCNGLRRIENNQA